MVPHNLANFCVQNLIFYHWLHDHAPATRACLLFLRHAKIITGLGLGICCCFSVELMTLTSVKISIRFWMIATSGTNQVSRFFFPFYYWCWPFWYKIPWALISWRFSNCLVNFSFMYFQECLVNLSIFPKPGLWLFLDLVSYPAHDHCYLFSQRQQYSFLWGSFSDFYEVSTLQLLFFI